MKSILTGLICCFFFCQTLLAQSLGSVKRIELQAEQSGASFFSLPIGDKGVILCNETGEKKNKQDIWKFVRYGTDFKTIWERSYQIDSKFIYKGFTMDQDVVYLLFMQNKKILLLQLEAIAGSLKSTEVEIPTNVNIEHFMIMGEEAILAGNSYENPSCFKSLFGCSWLFNPLPKEYAMFYAIHLQSGKLRTPSLVYPGASYVIDVQQDSVDGVLHTLVRSQARSRERSRVFVNELDENYKRVRNYEVTVKDASRELLSGKIASVGEDKKVILGTYRDTQSGWTSGMYIAGYQANKQEYIKFYNFAKFTRFFESLSKKRVDKIKKRNQKKEAKGRELGYNYRMLIHDLIVRNDEYIMIAEAYYPEYRTESYIIGYGAYGQPIYRTRTVFVGYRYTHAVVAAFSKSGELLWDNTFEIWNILTFSLRKRVRVSISGDEITMMYASFSSIATKIIRGNQVVEGKESVPINPADANDKIKGAWSEDILYWYDNYFLMSGYQRIKNNTKEDRKRTVFYFDKIKFQ